MFDIGFPELLLVSIIALVVIGPEKLPGTIRTVSLWLGRLRHSLTTLRDEIEAEVGAEELKRRLREDSLLREVKETREQLDEIIHNAKREMNDSTRPAASAGTAAGSPANSIGGPARAESKPADDKGADPKRPPV